MFFYQVKLGCVIPTLVKTELYAKRMLKEATTVFVLEVIQEPSARVTPIFYMLLLLTSKTAVDTTVGRGVGLPSPNL